MPPFNPNIAQAGATTRTFPMKDNLEYAVARRVQPRAFYNGNRKQMMNPGAKRYMRQQARMLRKRRMGGPGEVRADV